MASVMLPNGTSIVIPDSPTPETGELSKEIFDNLVDFFKNHKHSGLENDLPKIDALTAEKLKNTRKINDVDFDGLNDISIDVNPVGTIIYAMRKDTPAGYLKLDGSLINKSVYSNLVNNSLLQIKGLATFVSGSNLVTGLTSTLDLCVGMPIESVVSQSNSIITQINSLTSITLDKAANFSATTDFSIYPFGASPDFSLVALPDLRGENLRSLDGNRNINTTGFLLSTTNGSNIISGIPSTKFMFVGMPLNGDSIPAGTTVLSITSNTSITISNKATATSSRQINFTGRRFASFENDQFQGHYHDMPYTQSHEGSMIRGIAGTPNTNTIPGTNGATIGAVVDGSNNGTPRIGAETRGRNFALPLYIKY